MQQTGNLVIKRLVVSWFDSWCVFGTLLTYRFMVHAAVEPLSQGITNVATKRLQGRKFNIGLDWPFIAGRAEIWACANVLAPIMLVEAVLLSNVGNGILPLAGIIAMGVTPALLVVTRGKVSRQIPK